MHMLFFVSDWVKSTAVRLNEFTRQKASGQVESKFIVAKPRMLVLSILDTSKSAANRKHQARIATRDNEASVRIRDQLNG